MVVQSVAPSNSLKDFLEKVNAGVKQIPFMDYTISNLSIESEIKPHQNPHFSVFIKASTKDEKNPKDIQTVQLSVPNDVVKAYLERDGAIETKNGKFDVVVERVDVSKFHSITIHVKSLKLTGVSERERLKSRLHQYCVALGSKLDIDVYRRERVALPKMITKVLAITSSSSTIKEDILDKIELPKNKVDILPCSSSQTIAGAIIGARDKGYDAIVLYRGGREDVHMDMFSHEAIIDAIVDAETSIPVLSALGHAVDKPFIDSITDVAFKTPTDFAAEINNHNRKNREDNNASIKYLVEIFGALRVRLEDENNTNREKNHSLIEQIRTKEKIELESIGVRVQHLSEGAMRKADNQQRDSFKNKIIIVLVVIVIAILGFFFLT